MAGSEKCKMEVRKGMVSIASRRPADAGQPRGRRDANSIPLPKMGEETKRYMSETGEKPIYRNRNGADFHTLKYVRWLEAQLATVSEERDGLQTDRAELHKLATKHLRAADEELTNLRKVVRGAVEDIARVETNDGIVAVQLLAIIARLKKATTLEAIK